MTFFFVLTPRPPSPTLFPYTRSSDLRTPRAHPCAIRAGRGGASRRSGHRAHAEHRGQSRGGRRRDRKSTRLNSSHTVISYAVFCLKKKKKNANKNNR